MREPLQIVYRNLKPSDSIERCVRKRLAALEDICDDIIGCEILIETDPAYSKTENHVHIHLDVTVPGGVLSLDNDTNQPKSIKNITAQLKTVFSDMYRQLERYAVQDSAAPAWEDLPFSGTVSELTFDMNYGVITGAGGLEVYFHRNNVVDNAFDRLEVGSPVRFAVLPCLIGAQAVCVKLVSH